MQLVWTTAKMMPRRCLEAYGATIGELMMKERGDETEERRKGIYEEEKKRRKCSEGE